MRKRWKGASVKATTPRTGPGGIKAKMSTRQEDHFQKEPSEDDALVPWMQVPKFINRRSQAARNQREGAGSGHMPFMGVA
jgi:hypothetical protein